MDFLFGLHIVCALKEWEIGRYSVLGSSFVGIGKKFRVFLHSGRKSKERKELRKTPPLGTSRRELQSMLQGVGGNSDYSKSGPNVNITHSFTLPEWTYSVKSEHSRSSRFLNSSCICWQPFTFLSSASGTNKVASQRIHSFKTFLHAPERDCSLSLLTVVS